MSFRQHAGKINERAREKMQLGFKISEDGLRTTIGKLREIGFTPEDALAIILNSLHKINHPKN